MYTPVSKDVGALSVGFVIPEFTDIFAPIGPGEGAKTISPSVPSPIAGALGQTPRLSRTEQQHSKSETQKCRQISHRESLIELGAGGDSRHQGKKSNGVVVIPNSSIGV